MFALYSSGTIEEDKGLYFTVGNTTVIGGTPLKLQKKFPTLKELLKISSDLNVISNFKCKLKANTKLIIRQHFVERLEVSESGNTLIKIILYLFLETHSCSANTIQVCQECHSIVKLNECKIIGKVLVGQEEFISCLKIKEDWVCRDCRTPAEFVLIVWSVNGTTPLESNNTPVVGTRNCILTKLNEIRRKRSDVHVILNICPSFRSREISNYVKHKFLSVKPYQISHDNEVFYQESVLDIFLDYFVKHCVTKRKVIRLCKTCNHVFLSKGERDLGEIFLINKEEIKLLHEFSPHWTCSNCEKSLFILYALESADGSLDYYIAANKRDRDALGKYEKRYIRTYPCFKFLCPYVKGEVIKFKIGQKKHLTIRGNIIKTKFPKHELISSIYYNHYRDSIKLGILQCYQICSDCGREYDVYLDRKHFGSCWYELPHFSPHFCCPAVYCGWHRFNNMLYWNMGGYNSLSQLEFDEESIFNGSDIICLLGTGHTCEEDITNFRFLQNRLVISEPAMKSTSGQAKGGIMILIKDDILVSHEKLSYSSKGLFIKLEHASNATIIGAVLWPEFDEEPSDCCADWLLELEGILKTYNGDNVKFILGGSFNCRIGNLNNGFTDEAVFWNGKLNVQRNSLDVVVDERGEQLAELMKKHDFILCNGRAESDFPGKFSYTIQNHRVISDLVWVNQKCGYSIKDMKILKISAQGCHNAAFVEFSKPPD